VCICWCSHCSRCLLIGMESDCTLTWKAAVSRVPASQVVQQAFVQHSWCSRLLSNNSSFLVSRLLSKAACWWLELTATLKGCLLSKLSYPLKRNLCHPPASLFFQCSHLQVNSRLPECDARTRTAGQYALCLHVPVAALSPSCCRTPLTGEPPKLFQTW